MIYLDTSCLIKLLREEPESNRVRLAVDNEQIVIVSSLVELETEIQLKASALGGIIRPGQWRHYQIRLTALRNLDPFHFRHLPGSVFVAALRQHQRPRAGYCRTVDRLHLAAIEELGLSRLMTLDRQQARVATDLGFQVLYPG